MHSINTHLRELFYWLTVIFTFALGTAAGDFAAGTLGLGTLASTFVFLAVILVPAAGYKWMRLNEVLASWFAYTITVLSARPSRTGCRCRLRTGTAFNWAPAR